VDNLSCAATGKVCAVSGKRRLPSRHGTPPKKWTSRSDRIVQLSVTGPASPSVRLEKSFHATISAQRNPESSRAMAAATTLFVFLRSAK
jgi:hypothetical protein